MGSKRKKYHAVRCEACNAKFNMSDKLWNKRVLGRVTTIHCRKCSAPIKLDGRVGTDAEEESGSERPSDAAAVSLPEVASSAPQSETPRVGEPEDGAAERSARKPAAVSSPRLVSTPPKPAMASDAVRSVRPVSSRVPPVLAPRRSADHQSAILRKPVVPLPPAAPARIEPEKSAAMERTSAPPDSPRVEAKTTPAPADQPRVASKVPAAPARPVIALEPSTRPAAAARVKDEVAKPSRPSPGAEPPAVKREAEPESHEASAAPEKTLELAPTPDAESVPSLRALVVASPVDGEEVEASEARAANAAAPSADGSVVPRDRASLRPEASLAPVPRSRYLGIAAVLAAAAGVVLYLGASQPQPRVDTHASEASSEVMAMPLEEQPSSEAAPSEKRPPEVPVFEDGSPVAKTKSAPEAKPSLVNLAAQALAEERGAVPYDEQHLGFALRWARKQALACHQGGRAAGSVTVEITFAPKGKVSEVVLHGEPIASAPVAGCISSYYKAMLLPPYKGQPFTIREELTLL